MLHDFRLLRRPTVLIIQQFDEDLEAEALASAIALHQTGRFSHVATTILVAAQLIAAMMPVWTGMIETQLENGSGIGIGIGTGMGGIGAGFWEGLEDRRRGKESGPSSPRIHLHFEGQV